MNRSIGLLLVVVAGCGQAQTDEREGDTFDTVEGALTVTPIFHGSLMLTLGERVVHVDPWSSGDYDGLPDADLVLISHPHQDHMDPDALAQVSRDDTVVIAPAAVAETITQARVLENEESADVIGITIEAVPMYNLQRGPEEDQLYHEPGWGNGYVLSWGGLRLYISGDTECIPEMRELQDIDIAFVSMNLPFTMTPAEAAECVRDFRPAVVYPYHYRDQNPEEFRDALADVPEVEVRLREWYAE